MMSADPEFDELIDCLHKLESFIDQFEHTNSNEIEEEYRIEEMLYLAEQAVEICSFYSSWFESIDYLQTVSAQISNKLHELSVIFCSYRDLFSKRLEELGKQTPNQNVYFERSGNSGRPRMVVNEDQVLGLRSLGIQWQRIGSLLGISTKTLRRKRYGFESGMSSFSDLTEAELDDLVRDLVIANSNMGEGMLQGLLLSRGYKIQRSKLRASNRRVNPNPKGFNKRRIFRRTYNVSFPNALW